MPVPSRVGRYLVERVLGSGAMGHVYLARDPALGRAVAIKTIRDLDLQDDARTRFLARFQNEARAAALLAHPGVVQVFDVGEDAEAGPFVVFEYVPGTTLRQRIRAAGAIPLDELVGYARQAAAALDAAHAVGIVHRDIKPENLLVTEAGELKLADFGIARVPNASLTEEGQFLGTPCYAAPETIQGGRYGPQSDVFSFAAVLYEALTGSRAYPGDEALAVVQQVLHATPPPPSTVAPSRGLPAEIDRVILRGLARTLDDRFLTAGELASAFERATGPRARRGLSGSATALDPSLAGRLERPGQRRRLTRTAILGSCAAAGLGALGLWAAAGGPGDVAPQNDEVHRSGVDAGGARGSPWDGGESDRAPIGDAAPDAAGEDAGAPDAQRDAPQDDEPLPTTGHEREERAKDALDAARRHLARGDAEGARSELERAARLDPGNPEVDRLRLTLTEGPSH